MAGWSPEVNDIFLKALEVGSEAARSRFLEKECRGNAQLRGQVEQLLSASERAGSFLESPPTDVAAAIVTLEAHEPIPEGLGGVIGPYKLLERIGEGGFGSVYMAEQREPVQRRVALKIIKLGMDTRQVIARFEAERQALARMEHPNIAKVLDAGATDSGRPYFVMELVKGVPITRFCDDHQLPPRERLALFADVCHAVQHAHQKGVIHRDLKPTNVLVSRYDDGGASASGRSEWGASASGRYGLVKIIDFGIAKATAGRLTEKTVFTELRQMIGTPAYMSPEQAGLSDLDIDTRSDIYSLGVLLYELLTGTTPFDAQTLVSAGYDEMRRIIREVEPEKPSTRIAADLRVGRRKGTGIREQGTGKTEAPSSALVASPDPRSPIPDPSSAIDIARCRHTDPPALVRLLHGDLDWIVMKCLEKDRTRRYETASAVALDVQHYLTNQPILARPPGAIYQFKKLVARHKAVFVSGAAVFVVLVLAVIGLSVANATIAKKQTEIVKKQAEIVVQRDEAHAQRQRAEANLQRAKDAVNQMLTEVGAKDLAHIPGMEPVRRALLERALKFYEGFLNDRRDDPAVREEIARTHMRIGQIVYMLARTDDGRAHFVQAVELLQALATDLAGIPGEAGRRADVLSALGDMLGALRKIPEAEQAYRSAISLFTSLRTADAAHIEYRSGLARANYRLGGMLDQTGRPVEALPLYCAARELLQPLSTEDPNNPDYAFDLKRVLNDIGASLQRQGRAADAVEPLLAAAALEESLAARFPGKPELRLYAGMPRFNLGIVYQLLGRTDEAEAAYRAAIKTYQDLATEFPARPGYRDQAASVLSNLVVLLRRAKRLDGAEAAGREMLDLLEKLVGDYPDVAGYRYSLGGALHNYALVLVDRGAAPEQLRPLFERAIEQEDKAIELDPHWPEYKIFLRNHYDSLASVLEKLGQRDEAEAALQSSLNISRQLATDFPQAAENRVALASSLTRVGEGLVKAERWPEAEQAYREAEYILTRVVADAPAAPEPRESLADTIRQLAALLRRTDRPEDAAKAYQRVIAESERLVADFPQKAEYRNDLVEDLMSLGSLCESTGPCAAPIAQYRVALERDPNCARCHATLALFLGTCADPACRDAQEALVHARRAVALEPNEGRWHTVLGIAEYRAGNYSAAAAALEKSAALLADRTDAWTWFFLAMTRERLGEHEVARQSYDRAVAWMDKNAPGAETLRQFRAEAEDVLRLTAPAAPTR